MLSREFYPSHDALWTEETWVSNLAVRCKIIKFISLDVVRGLDLFSLFRATLIVYLTYS